MFQEIKTALGHLGDGKFLHIVLEPVLIWGPLIAVVYYLLSLWVIKNPKAQTVSLIVLAVACFMIWPVSQARRAALPIASPSVQGMKAQGERRNSSQWFFYAIGGLAISAVFLGGSGKGKAGVAFSILAVAGGLSASAAGVWLQWHEAKIYHADMPKSPKEAP